MNVAQIVKYGVAAIVSHLTSHDIDAVKTILESIIVKNRIEKILPGRQEPSWEEQMREVQDDFRKKAAHFPEQEIENIIDEAESTVRAEEKARSGGRSIGA